MTMVTPPTSYAGPSDHPHRREPGLVQVQNETDACSSRITREGRRITYKARIIQQPDRARACGSGAKSCADRRPVDPPPIIELRIFEGPADNEKDITYDYDANFFVFATLEHARHMASGRAAGPAPNNVPVLTGSPVAGMALLERPTPAGYFIFPDLSVRHEGKYRLNFSLYEELKSQKDMDSETSDNAAVQKQPHVSHRLEVKTIPFTVYSAKKFPGLTCSTHLSQMFAEQGCRVRIRRDVRMRRRETAKGQAYEEEEEQQQQARYQYENRPRASATPDAYAPPNVGTPHQPQPDTMDRQRSSSIVSNGHAHVRRPSSEHMHQQYQQGVYVTSPQTPQGMYQPQQQWSQPPPQPPQQPYMSAQPPYAQPQYPAVPPPPMAPPSYGYVPPQYQQEQHHSRHNSMEYPPPAPHQGPPRSAGTPQPQPQQQLPPFHGYNAPSYPPATSQYTQPPPPATAIPPVSPNVSMAPQPPTPTYMPHVKSEVPQQQQQESAYYRPSASTSGTKRDFASSFDTQPLEQPLRHGARPTATGLDPKFNYRIEPASHAGTGDDDLGLDLSAMEYRRADGTQRRRQVPLQ